MEREVTVYWLFSNYFDIDRLVRTTLYIYIPGLNLMYIKGNVLNKGRETDHRLSDRLWHLWKIQFVKAYPKYREGIHHLRKLFRTKREPVCGSFVIKLLDIEERVRPSGYVYRIRVRYKETPSILDF